MANKISINTITFVLLNLLFIQIQGATFVIDKDYLDKQYLINFSQCDYPINNEVRIKWMEQMIVDTQQIFKNHYINSWIASGTLLGVVREKRILPWDWDSDLHSFTENISYICNNTNRIIRDLNKLNYTVYACSLDYLRVCRANTSRLLHKSFSDKPVDARIDIYGATRQKDNSYKIAYSRCIWNFSNLFPLADYSFNNITFIGPKTYEYWLQMTYGKNWRIPNKYGGNGEEYCNSTEI